MFGPFTEGGVQPVVGGSAVTDTDKCYGHIETGNNYGYHYHARIIHDGKTDVFHGCMIGLLESGTATRLGSSGGPAGGGGGGPGQAPPDLPSLLLNARICYLGMPLVPAVTELIVAELLYLGSDNPEKPVYFYINSTGSQNPNGESVGFETEAYAIMDTMRYIRPEIQTVCIGKAHGNAAMLLASGAKGKRYALPNSSIALHPPRLNRKVDTATNLMIQANELYDNTTTHLEFLAECTGKTQEELQKDISRVRYFTPEEAITYGIIDKVVNPNQGGLGATLERKDYEAELKRSQGSSRGSFAGSRE